MGIADADGDLGGSGVLVTGSVVLVGDVLRLFAREMRRPDMPDVADDDRME